jgi:8-oxo-dGTP pyrophosphatase MutT (NUDIX family)
MVQKYKVFVNEIPVLISKINSTESKSFESNNELDAKKFQILCKQIFEGKNTADSYEFEIYRDFDSLYFDKHFKWIEAAGGCVFAEDSMLWMFRLGKWDLPKGKIEKGENTQEAALREVEEECGISDLEIQAELEPTYHVYYFKEKWILKKTHWFLMKSGKVELTPQIEEGITEVLWVKMSDIEMQLSNTYPGIRELVSKLQL